MLVETGNDTRYDLLSIFLFSIKLKMTQDQERGNANRDKYNFEGEKNVWLKVRDTGESGTLISRQ